MKGLSVKKIRLSEYIRKYLWLCVSPLIVCILLLAVYMIKGIYPFGNRNIAYFDMTQLCVPIYYHIYDVFHFKTDLFLNWNVGFGASMADALGSYLFFPTNLFFLFVQRNKILESMSFFLILQLSVAACFMTLYSFRISSNRILSMICGVAYASCGFAIQYYTNIATFLDSLIVFPLLMYAYDRLVKEGKKTLYVICIILVMFCNIQSAFSVIIYLLFKSFFTVLEIKEKKTKKQVLMSIFLCSICGCLISSFFLLPAVTEILNSPRTILSEGSSYIEILKTIICENCQQNKNFMLYGSEFIFPLILLLIIKKKAKKYFFSFVMIGLLLLPIIFENINILWHAGSYVLFPVRFGYMLTFECLHLLLISWKEFPFVIKRKKLVGVAVLMLIPLYAIFFLSFMNGFREFGICDEHFYISYWKIIIFLFVIFICFFSYSAKDRIVMYVLIVLIQAIGGYWRFIGVEKDYYDECRDDIIINSEILRPQVSNLRKIYDRIKDSNNYFNANYSFITGVASGSSWINGISKDLPIEMIRMGYTYCYTRTLDSGGTTLSDLMLGYKYNITQNDTPTYLSDTVNDNESKLSYIDNSLDFGFYTDSIMPAADGLGLDYQNYLYQYLSKDDSEIMSKIDLNNIPTFYDESYNESECKYTKKIKVAFSEKTELYLWGILPGIEGEDNYYNVLIDGKEICMPVLYVKDNIYFPHPFRNGFLYLGTYENEEIELEIKGFMEEFNNLQLGCLDCEKLEKIVENQNELYSVTDFEASNRKINMNVVMKQGGYLTIPIGASSNWKLYVNGKKTDIENNINDAFVCFYLEQGENHIELCFIQDGLIIGIIFSLVGIGLLIVLNTNDYLIKNNCLNTTIMWIFLITIFVCFFAFYTIPILFSFYYMAKNRISLWDVLTTVS